MNQGHLEMDHLFMFIEPGGPEIEALQRLGLTETYRRAHPGQGTANACFAFDNLYLELLWLTNEAEARSPAIERTRLWERSRWRTLGSCPFGFAFRGDLARAGVPTWDYQPPYLPPGLSIQVATDGDDPMQPMLFGFPGSTAPRDWPPKRRGRLQRDAGWVEACVSGLRLPAGVKPCAALVSLAGATGLELQPGEHSVHAVSLKSVGVDGSLATTLVIPGGL